MKSSKENAARWSDFLEYNLYVESFSKVVFESTCIIQASLPFYDTLFNFTHYPKAIPEFGLIDIDIQGSLEKHLGICTQVAIFNSKS